MDLEGLLAQGQTLAVTYGLQLIAALAIFFIGKWLAGVVTGIVARIMEKNKIEQTIVSFSSNLIFAGLVTFVGIAALAQLGIQTASFIAVLGAAGLAVGLALQGSLSNFAAGVLIVLFRPFRVGDYIEAGGEQGEVKDIQIFATKLLTLDNRTVTVPNGAISSGSIVNYTEMSERRVDFVIGVAYDSDIKLAQEVILKALKQNEFVLDEPAPLVAVEELGDSSVNFAVRPWSKSENYWDTYFSVPGEIKLALDAAGVTIPFPQMDLHIQKSDAFAGIEHLISKPTDRASASA